MILPLGPSEDDFKKVLKAIIDRVLALQKPTIEDLNRIKIEVCREYNIGFMPSNADLIGALEPEEHTKLLSLLTRKRTRAASGVTVVAVMTEPRPCPHGRCAYCPGGPDEGVPQSYTGHEPASMRGAQNDYDPFRQVTTRIGQLRSIGHPVDKVDLIIMGGTFPAAPIEYQEWFVKNCLDALSGARKVSLNESKTLAETAMIRNVGITVETRPDTITPELTDHLLHLGVTRVELGVQNVYDDIYELVERSHKVRDVVEATKILKDSGLKVCYHMMPGLPGSDRDRDIDGFIAIFNDPRFMPDMIKIYPTLVIGGTKLFDWWKSGTYSPLTMEDAVDLVAELKEAVPPWIRIMRVQRDIPSNIIEAGVTKSNLRQLVFERMKQRGNRCRCIRCREVGHRAREGIYSDPGRLDIKRIVYSASDGIENFISVEEEEAEVLIGFVRLRLPSEKAHRPEMKGITAIVRELHIYGRMVPVGSKIFDAWQHRGWGQVLMGEAERIAAEEYDVDKILVMSALGTKQYYERLGYERDGAYMSKILPKG